MHWRLTLVTLLASAARCFSSPSMAPTTTSTPQDPFKEATSLANAPKDSQYLIASQLAEVSPAALREFAHASEALRVATLPSIYRHLRLGKSGSIRGRAYQALIANFQDNHEKGAIAKHVRSITVTEKLPTKDLALILERISELGKLHDLSWNTAAHMPKDIYDKLHSSWPDLEISVTVLDRQNVKTVTDRQMDMRLLSSPLLRRLTYVVYNQGYQAEHPSRSEWPKLTQALVDGGHVRVLRVQTQSDGREIDGYVSEYDGVQVIQNSEPEKLARLDISAHTRLPQLEELSINTQRYWGSSSYLWDAEHCLLLRNAMDWSHLRKLDFGSDNPHTFFSTFTGLLPNLKALCFEVMGESVAEATKFIESLDSLESLYVGQAQAGLDELWPAIMKHKQSLKELILGPALGSYYSTQYPDRSRLEEIAHQLPGLERLGWDIPCNHNVDPTHLEIISTMNLKKLDLFVRIPDAASAYSDKLVFDFLNPQPDPPLDKARSKQAAIAIAEQISAKQQHPLDWLTLHISRVVYRDRAEPFLMQAKLQLRRREDASADAGGEEKYEVRGSMAWYGLLSLEEELSLE